MFPGSQNHTQLRTIGLNEDLIQLWSLQRLGIYMSVYLSIHLSVCLSIHLFIYLSIYLSVLCAQSCLTLCNPMDCIACQVPLSMGFSRQEYWSRLPFPTPGNLSYPGIRPVSPAMGGRIFTTSHLGSTPSLLDAGILTAWRFYIIIWI